MDLFEKPVSKVTKFGVQVTPLASELKKQISKMTSPKDKAKANAIISEIKKLEVIKANLEKKKKELDKKTKDIKAKIKGLEFQDPKGKKDIARFKEVYLPYIKKNCSQIYSILKKEQKFLFRGILKKVSSDAFVANSPTNRSPADSSKEAQEYLDNMLKKEGFVALRSNSIFVSSNYSQTYDYGDNVFYIFPLDGFHYMWSTKNRDLVVDRILNIQDYNYLLIKIGIKFIKGCKAKYKELVEQGKKVPETSEYFIINKFYNEILDKLDYDSLQAGLRYCEKKGIKSFEKIINKAKIELDKTFINKQGFLKTDINTAIKKGNEICIHGKYVAIPESMFSDLSDKEIAHLFFSK